MISDLTFSKSLVSNIIFLFWSNILVLVVTSLLSSCLFRINLFKFSLKLTLISGSKSKEKANKLACTKRASILAFIRLSSDLSTYIKPKARRINPIKLMAIILEANDLGLNKLSIILLVKSISHTV